MAEMYMSDEGSTILSVSEIDKQYGVCVKDLGFQFHETSQAVDFLYVFLNLKLTIQNTFFFLKRF